MLLTLMLSLALAQPPTATLSLSGMFSTGKATLTADGAETVRAWAALIQARPGQTFEIGVHTDSQGSSAYNLTLSQRRAEAMRQALIAAGVSAEQIVAKGYGEERPAAPNDSAEGRAQNRRAELRAVGEGAVSSPSASAPQPEPAPQPEADACAVIDALVAQAPGDLVGLRGAVVDGNFYAADAIPGLSGEGRIHRRGEFWQTLYEGTSAADADAAWAAGTQTLARCLTSGWSTAELDWVRRVPRYDPGSSGWETRELVMEHEGSAPAVRVLLEQERWPESHTTLLRIYQPAE